MSKELLIDFTTGNTVYCTLRVVNGSNAGKFIDEANSALVDFVAGDWLDYDVTTPELGTSGLYEGDIPSFGALGIEFAIEAQFFDQAGGSPAITDTHIKAPIRYEQLSDGWVATGQVRGA